MESENVIGRVFSFRVVDAFPGGTTPFLCGDRRQLAHE
jgi:hypothetical protein